MTEITITGKLGNIYSFTGDYNLRKGDKVYTAPQQRTWVGLTIKEIEWCFTDANGGHFIAAKNIEALLKEKNA
jgi:hypothetical protein